MIIKNVALDIVCGITSKMPETGMTGSGIRRKIQCGQIFPDQRTDEPEIPGTYQRRTGKDTRRSTSIM